MAGNGNGMYAANVSGLTKLQQKMVSDAAEVFARQLVSRPELSQPVAQHLAAQQQVQKDGPSQSVLPVARQPGIARAPPVPVSMHSSSNVQGQQQQGVQRAEDVLLAVAGSISGGDFENLTEVEFVATSKKKGPCCFRCRKTGHFLNDREAVLCECCQRPEHASKDCPLLRAPRLVLLCMVWVTRI
jgi:hypothetical protein